MLRGQLLWYLGSAALVALSITAAVAALVYTYATTMYYTHFKEFAVLRTLGLKKRGLAALALMLFALPAAGSLTATALALTVETPGVSTAQTAPIQPAVVTAATLLASAPALRRLYAITPAEALRTE
jgi:ABC-type antimicrobial peptide transport system permease subunit